MTQAELPGSWDVLEMKAVSPHPQHSTVAGRGTAAGPESGLLSNTGKCIVQGDTPADKAKDFVGEDAPGDEQRTGTQEDCSAS